MRWRLTHRRVPVLRDDPDEIMTAAANKADQRAETCSQSAVLSHSSIARVPHGLAASMLLPYSETASPPCGQLSGSAQESSVPPVRGICVLLWCVTSRT